MKQTIEKIFYIENKKGLQVRLLSHGCTISNLSFKKEEPQGTGIIESYEQKWVSSWQGIVITILMYPFGDYIKFVGEDSQVSEICRTLKLSSQLPENVSSTAEIYKEYCKVTKSPIKKEVSFRYFNSN